MSSVGVCHTLSVVDISLMKPLENSEQIYHGQAGYLQIIKGRETVKFSELERLVKFCFKTGICCKYPGRLSYICLITSNKHFHIDVCVCVTVATHCSRNISVCHICWLMTYMWHHQTNRKKTCENRIKFGMKVKKANPNTPLQRVKMANVSEAPRLFQIHPGL